MKSSAKRILAIILATLMLLPMAACGNTDGEGSDTLPPKEGDTLSEGETTDPNYTCGLPADLNFGGTEVNILYAKVAGREDEMPSERLGKGTISDAVYERNLAVENRLGVKLSLVERDSDGDADNTLTS